MYSSSIMYVIKQEIKGYNRLLKDTECLDITAFTIHNDSEMQGYNMEETRNIQFENNALSKLKISRICLSIV